MNCVAANICSHPSQYCWGTGKTFFCQDREAPQTLGDLSRRKRMRILHSCSTVFPLDWLISPKGYILPESYVKTDYVESVFKTARRMEYFLVNSSKAKKRVEASEEQPPTFKDQLIISALPELCKGLFRNTRLEDLSTKETTELFRQIRFRFSANIYQIARVTGKTYEETARLLDSD